MKRSAGFTFLEILVALAILAAGLGAAIRASAGSADTVAALRERQMASWVAENRLSLLLASRAWPAPGSSDGEAAMGRQRYRWRQTVSTTPQAGFRRVELSVYSGTDEGAPAARLVGYLTAPRP